MIRVALIGSGNLAQHLARALTNSDSASVVQVFARQPSDWKLDNIPIIADLSLLAESDIYIIAVSDGAIPAVSQQMPFHGRLVVHTAGSVSIEALDAKNRRGVFYPLQSFSKERDLNFSDIPICIEAESDDDREMLRELAEGLSNSVIPIDSDKRRALHVAAVFTNNFVNHLYTIGNDICLTHGIPPDILKPLIRETAAKVMTLSPQNAQTGPAIRHDQATIAAHHALLSDQNQQRIYSLLTQSIQNHGNKL